MHHMHISLITAPRQIRYNCRMSWWDEDWPLYAAAVAVPIAVAVGLWFVSFWFGE